MNNLVKKSIYTTVWWALILGNSINNTLAFNTKWSTTAGNAQLEWNAQTDMVTVVQNMVWFIVGLLYLFAVIMTLYWGFSILTAWGDEEKVKKWKNTIVRWAMWLIVIFLASTLVNWILSLFATWWAATN